MSKPILSYFNFPGGRGEDCRIALHVAGIDFVDDRVNGADWASRKGEMPFGSMPVLTVNGVQIAQSSAILSLIGRKHDLMPSDLLQAARVDAVMQHCEDCRNAIEPTLGIQDPDQKRAAREAIAATFMPGWASQLEGQLQGDYVAGDTLTVGDLKVYVLMRWFMEGGLDYMGSETFEDTPALRAHYARVADHPGVVSWYAR